MKSSTLRLASYLVNYATSVPVCNQELFLELELPDVTEFGFFLYFPLSKSQLRDLLSMYFMLIFFRLLSDRSSDSPGHFKIHGRAYSHSTAFFSTKQRPREMCLPLNSFIIYIVSKHQIREAQLKISQAFYFITWCIKLQRTKKTQKWTRARSLLIHFFFP